MGRDAFSAGDSGFAGGSLGMGATNVVNENEAVYSGDGTVTPMGGNVMDQSREGRAASGSGEEVPLAGDEAGDLTKRAMVGIRDSRSHLYASSVEMVTCPDTYPIWRTRRPVVVMLTDSSKKGNSTMDADGENNNEPSVFHHRYRYLVVTPGAENEGSHGLSTFDLDGVDDMTNMFNKTKISSGSLTHLGFVSYDAMTSNDTGSSFPVTLWENPFLENEDAHMRDAVSRNSMASSGGALSVFSEATSVRSMGGGTATDYELVNLPYRTLDIDASTASIIKNSPFSSSEQMYEDSSLPQYTEDGILIDNWNGCHDVTYRPYRIREGLMAQRNNEQSDADSEGDTSMSVETDKPRRSIFIVCYHLPVIVSKNPNTGEWQACWAESLLSKTANSSFVSSYDAHWVGTVTTNSPIVDEADQQALQSLLATMDCTALFFNESVRDAHYKGYCKQVLWLAFHHVDLLDMHDPAFSMDLDATHTKWPKDGTLFDLHSLWDQRQVGQWWEAYNTVNRTFAVEVAKMVKPDDVVWVHDYHLSLLPRMLVEEEKKMKAPRLTKKIFFLHIPFPVSMIFKEMKGGKAILEGILHADVVGFHGFSDARHFLSSAKRILGLPQSSLEGGLIGVRYQKRMVVVTMSSVSIEPYMVSAAMQLPTAIDGEAELRSKHAGRLIIAGLDAAQYLSGVGLKLSAYERLLRDAPTWRDKVVLVQRCLIPGARLLDESRTIQEIRLMVKRIQSTYGNAVIDYEEMFGSTLPVDQRLALWKASDYLLCTEVRGGLNLWPLEYVYAQKGLDVPGIVIASEFTAVFGILNGAMRISPFDVKATLATVDKALTMSKEEKEGRHLRDIDFVSSSSSAQWIHNVLRDLQDQSLDNQRNDESERKLASSEIQNVAEFLASERDEQFTQLDPKTVISAYKSSSRRVICLDFNGTIVIKEAVDSFLKQDVIGSAGDAPPRAVLESLEKLCADPQNTVFVVSGDNNENVQKAIGNIPRLGLAASNGSCFSPPLSNGDSARTWLALDLGLDWDSVKKVTLPIMSKFTARTNGSFIKLSHSSIGWSHYSCDPEFGSLQAKYLVMELERELAAYDVRFVNLKGIVEVIPRRLNKGIIVKKILRDIAARDENAGVDFILCMGDDVSDEKMFTSVFSFVSEMDEEYANVVPSPPVMQLSHGTLSASQSFLVEAPSVRCKDANAPISAFTVAVGKKPSHASQYVDSAEDVADLLVKMAAGSADVRFECEREKESERQLGHFS